MEENQAVEKSVLVCDGIQAEKEKKKIQDYKFHALVETTNHESGERCVCKIEVDKKQELFRELEKYNNPNILMIVKGREVQLKKQVTYKL